MKTFLKKSVTMLLFLITLSCGTLCYAGEGGKGLNVEYHTQQEIKEYLKENNVDISAKTEYETVPSVTSPYKAGALTQKSLKSALKTLNAVRYIAGIGYHVTLDEEYNKQAQAASLVNAVNGSLSHFPTQPAGMKDALYELGYQGASSSNIAWTSWETGLGYSIISLWMEDGDASNIDRLGHRRWILNPAMGKTGFGLVAGNSGTFTTVYAFDRSDTDADEYGVAWPAQNMPVEYFGSVYPWSISMGFFVDKTKVDITLTRKNDGKTWKFSPDDSDGYFNVDNAGYGMPGCIIFRPDDITYKAGDRFHVEIAGLVDEVSYDVNFFSVEADDCSHTYKSAGVEKKATLTSNGKETYSCSNCGAVKTKTIYKASAISMSKKSVTYNGNDQKLSVKVKDSKGKTIDPQYYSVSYKNAKNPGIANVTVKMKGKYSGKKTLTFTIKPQTVQISSVKPLKKAMQVTVKKGKKITGYQICYSTDKNFSAEKTETVTIKGQNNVTNKIENLKKGKKYYVRARSYKTVTVDGAKKNIYSAWSQTQNVKLAK